MSRLGTLVPRARANVSSADLARAARVSETGVARRRALAEHIGRLTEHEHVHLTASGRGALLALLATARRPRAVIPGYTCKAVAEAAHIAGLEVGYLDVSDGFNWAARDIAGKVGPDDVVIVTHQFGIAGRVAEVVDAARAGGALVIEDCAASLGGWSDGRRLGSFGDAAFYSFDTSKLVHVPPKGGALTTADPDWGMRAAAWLERGTAPMSAQDKARALAEAGVLAATSRRGYRLLHTVALAGRGIATTDGPGLSTARGPFYDTAFAEWQAAIAIPQIERVDELAAGARQRYAYHLEHLAGCRTIGLPPRDEAGEWAPIRFPILVPGDKFAFYRELLRRGVDCAFSFTYLAHSDGLARSSELADRVLDLPFYPRLATAEADRVIDAVLDLDAKWRA